MTTTSARGLIALQTLFLLVGSMFAWSKLVPQMTTFYAIYHTFWHFVGCTVPNPLTTACLYGSIGFVVALVWSLKVLGTPTYTGQRYLRNFLLGCSIFAASVVAYEALVYYKIIAATVSVSCTPGASPLASPCFTGMTFFILAFATSIFATRRLRDALMPMVETPSVNS